MDTIEITPEHPYYIPEGFIETLEEDDHLLYADTDSAYLLYDLPFDKYEDIHKLVSYIQGIAKEMGTIYNDALNYYVGSFANMNPKYNTMDFKSEVVAYKGFFNTKKFYSLAKAWDEGTFFENKPKMKITGGQIKKSDVTKISKDLLTDVYNLLVTDLEADDLVSMYRTIFQTFKNKYTMQIKEDLEKLKFDSFSIPKKWGETKKTVPPFVIGAKLFNSLVEDVFRPGDSFIVVKVIIDVQKLVEYFKDNPPREDDHLLQLTDVYELKEKIKNISIPPELTKGQRAKLLNILETLNIRIDQQEIIDFNINKKLEPFEKLFDHSVKMEA